MGLIGTKPNQTPTNADLGTMAYEDADYFRGNTEIDTLGTVTTGDIKNSALARSGRATIRPSLLLDFANSKTLDPRITFTRGGIGTYTDANGLIKNAASNEARFDHNPITGESLGLLIEEQRTNLILYSEKAVGNPVRASKILNSAIAPDGTMTALKLINDTSASADHFIGYGLMSSTTANAVNTASVYAKASEYSRFTLDICDSTDYITTRLRTYVNLSTVTAAVTIGSGSTTITPVGNGWYRVSVSGQAKNGSAGAVDLIITLANDSGQQAYTGDGASGLYLWGAQLEVGAFPTSYIPSADSFTSRASTGTFIGSNGLIQSAATNVARYNYNPLNLALSPKLLLEPAATNLLTYSEQFDNAVWTKSNTTLIANATIAPDGTLTADKLIEDTVATLHQAYTGVSITANTQYTYSFYVKSAERTAVTLEFGFANSPYTPRVKAVFDLYTITATSANTGTPTLVNTPTITNVGNGWFRCSIRGIFDTVSTSTALSICLANSSRSTTYAGDGTSGIYIWGAQLEVGNTATSYIPTTSAQVTRSADISNSAQSTRAADSTTITGTNFSSWYRQDEGTVFAKADSENTASVGNEQFIFGLSDGSGNNTLRATRVWASNRFYGLSAGATQFDLSGGTFTTNQVLLSCAYKLNDIAASFNGATVLTDATALIPTISQINLGGWIGSGYLNGHIAKLAYYPKRLSKTELQGLTTT
jgi:hypothetical protein